MGWIAVWFAVALFLGVLAMLLLPGHNESDMGWFSRLEQALTPDFDSGYNGTDLTRQPM